MTVHVRANLFIGQSYWIYALIYEKQHSLLCRKVQNVSLQQLQQIHEPEMKKKNLALEKTCEFYEKSICTLEHCMSISRKNQQTFSLAKSAWIYCSIILDYVKGSLSLQRTIPEISENVKSTQLKYLQKVQDTCNEICNIDLEAAEEIRNLAKKTLEKLPGIISMVEKGAMYQEVTVDEKKAIFSAMGLAANARGHWYTCPNGHVYAIGECGGAMQQSSCPECGATVGGGNHTLAPGNSGADAFLRDVIS